MNGVSVLEMSHSEVVSLIQALPKDFRLVVARKREFVDEELPIATEDETEVESPPTQLQGQGKDTSPPQVLMLIIVYILNLTKTIKLSRNLTF